MEGKEELSYRISYHNGNMKLNRQTDLWNKTENNLKFIDYFTENLYKN
ncbi:hypothetical protein TCT1_03280 [Xenorhabdus sp. TCT-1]|uniref:Uncharacterized protein n=1 Tax=Xenorhabdus taiwanensis TaxID=3085177 RepID=A0ABM8JRV2_9GAMM|nr:hypothetical protein TCT1_03280 [Xenorhabdus sp. TCT-1]